MGVKSSQEPASRGRKEHVSVEKVGRERERVYFLSFIWVWSVVGIMERDNTCQGACTIPVTPPPGKARA